MLPLDLWATPDAFERLGITKVQSDKRVDASKLSHACGVMLGNLVGLAFPFMFASVYFSLTTDKLLRIDTAMPSHVERLGNLLSVILCNEVRRRRRSLALGRGAYPADARRRPLLTLRSSSSSIRTGPFTRSRCTRGSTR